MINLDCFSLLALVHIPRVNSCIAAVYHTIGTQKQDTQGVQNQWKQQIFAAKWQILAPNPFLTHF